MKKILISSLVLLSVNTFAYNVVSKDRTYWDKMTVDKKLENNAQKYFNYDTDLAVLSAGKSSEKLAKEDAVNGLEKLVESYSYEILKEHLSHANLIGPGFNSAQMQDFAVKIANSIKANIKIPMVWQKDIKNGQYYALAIIKREDIKKITNQTFKERLTQVINSLNALKEGI